MSWIDELIAEGGGILSDFKRDEASRFIARAVGVLNDAGVETASHGLTSMAGRVAFIGLDGSVTGTRYLDGDYREDVRTLVLKLERLRDDRERGTGGGTVYNIDAHSENVNNVDASASAVALATASFTETCAAVDALDLDEDEKVELFDLLNDVRKARGDETLAKSAVKSLLDKAIEFGFETLRAVLPYVWGLLLSLTSAA